MRALLPLAATLALAACAPGPTPPQPSGAFGLETSPPPSGDAAAPGVQPTAAPEPRGVVLTIAGGEEDGYVDGPGASARFNAPAGLAIGSDGALYVADAFNHRIRRIDVARPDFPVTTVAGSGPTGADHGGFADGPGASARFFEPAQLAAAPDGSLYIADSFNHRVRRLRIEADGPQVVTVAGNGREGGQDGPGSGASFRVPFGLTLDDKGDLWVTDHWGHTVRRIADPSGKPAVTTVAGLAGQSDYRDGTGASARFSFPAGIVFDPRGFLYVIETGGCHLRRVERDGDVLTLNGLDRDTCGYEDGNLETARFSGARSLATWAGATGFRMLVADERNQVIRRVEVVNEAGDGEAVTYAGNEPGYEDGPLRAARFDKPRAVAVAKDGTIYAVDGHRIRRLRP